MAAPPLEAGAVKATVAVPLTPETAAVPMVGASGFPADTAPPTKLVQALPLYICSSPEAPQLLHQISNPANGATMAIFWE